MDNQNPNQNQSNLDEAQERLHAAMSAMFEALLLLLMLALTLIARVLQAVFTLARPALLAASVCVCAFGVYRMFAVCLAAYGQDLGAIVMALALAAFVPAALLTLALKHSGIWAVLFASGLLSAAAALGIESSPLPLRAALPVVVLAGCIFYFAFGQQNERRNENDREQRWECVAVADHDCADCVHGNPEREPDPKHHA